MHSARCACGALTLSLPGPSPLVVACHCIDCQRRTGSAFGLGAFHPAEAVTVSGPTTTYTRIAASGGRVRNHFCPTCGSTVYWQAESLPGWIGVAVGAMADPGHPAPSRSVFEQSKHGWVGIADAEHFPRGSEPRR